MVGLVGRQAQLHDEAVYLVDNQAHLQALRIGLHAHVNCHVSHRYR
jgi:hypothetical protein